MKRTYDIYTSAGKEALKKTFEMYSNNDTDIIMQATKMLMNVKSKYNDVNVEIIAKQGDRQILHITA